MRCCIAPLRSVKRSVVASEKFATFCPEFCRGRTNGSALRLPITITLLIAVAVCLLGLFAPASRMGVLSPIPRSFFRATLSPETGGTCADFVTREAEYCTGVTSGSVRRSRWHGGAHGASATTLSGQRRKTVRLIHIPSNRHCHCPG